MSVLALAGCTSYIPAKTLPLPISDREEVKIVTIPLPVIASSPNEGITYGALAALLFHNQKDEVTALLAPQLNRNQNFGVSGSLYGAYYPSPDRSFEVNFSASERVNEDYELKFRDQTLLDRKLELNGFVYALKDGSARFFGFQSSSSAENETNYADDEKGFTLSAGYPLVGNLQLVVGERLRGVRIDRGAVRRTPFIRELYTKEEVPGIEGFTAHAQSVALVYSTLDSATLPTRGIRARVAVESSNPVFGSSADYRHYDVEAKGYCSLKDGRYISVARVAYSQSIGAQVPFLERSTLGGENTLRGYGRNRFIDSSYLLANLEERIRLFRWNVFGVNADWEIAPFVDLGSVMASLDKAKASSFEFNPGVGFRGVVRPNIVGRVDVGIGREGPSLFVGLGYPF